MEGIFSRAGELRRRLRVMVVGAGVGGALAVTPGSLAAHAQGGVNDCGFNQGVQVCYTVVAQGQQVGSGSEVIVVTMTGIAQSPVLDTSVGMYIYNQTTGFSENALNVILPGQVAATAIPLPLVTSNGVTVPLQSYQVCVGFSVVTLAGTSAPFTLPPCFTPTL